MSEYAVETRSTTPKNFFAGEFPTVPETGTAGAVIAEYTPVTTGSDGKIVPIAAETKDAVIGIAAAAGAISMGWAISKASEGVSRQPEASGKIQTILMLGLVFIETAIIYALIVAILIIFVL